MAKIEADGPYTQLLSEHIGLVVNYGTFYAGRPIEELGERLNERGVSETDIPTITNAAMEIRSQLAPELIKAAVQIDTDVIPTSEPVELSPEVPTYTK